MTLEANPGPDDRGDLAGFARAGVTRLSLGRPEPGRRGAAVARPPPSRRRRGRRGPRGAGGGDRPGEPGPPLRPARPAPRDLDGDRRGGPRDGTGPRLVLRAHPRRPGRRRASPGRWGTTCRRRRAPAAGASGRAPARTRTGRPPRTRWPTPPSRAPACPGTSSSNWARPGAESRHNLVYWERRPYEAVGPGAHAFDGVRRRWNAARLDAWLGALAPAPGHAAALPPGDGEEIDAATAAAEELILGLRTAHGISRERALSRADEMAWAHEAGLVEDAPGERVRLTLRGRLLSNELFARLV